MSNALYWRQECHLARAEVKRLQARVEALEGALMRIASPEDSHNHSHAIDIAQEATNEARFHHPVSDEEAAAIDASVLEDKT